MTDSNHSLVRHIALRSAVALVIANVIGTGIFTTTGFLAADLGNPIFIFVLWILGGVLAFCGALCYGELGAAMPRAGAEYVYLRETYGPAFGFMSAFVSFIAGFPAPIAAALKSLVRYLSAFFPFLEKEPLVVGAVSLNDLIAIALVWLLVAIHMRGRGSAIRFNDLVTLIKVVGIVMIIVAVAAFGRGEAANFVYVSETYRGMGMTATLTAMATSLIFVMFCYSGWNAAAYVASEIVEPQVNLPRALLLGTSVVAVLYLGLNAVYFFGANVDELAGKVEVGLVASRQLLGLWGVSLVTLTVVVSLFASASAMTIAGPRVSFALGRDVPLVQMLGRTNSRGAPATAIIAQGIVTSIIILSGRVDQIIQYAGFTLALTSALAVSCVIVLRIRHPGLHRPFRAWAYPVTPIFFLAVTVWTMIWAFSGRPVESTLALMTVVFAGVIFFANARLCRRKL